MNDSELCVCKTSPFFDNICRSIETKGWVDIENEYYRLLKWCTKSECDKPCAFYELNTQFDYLKMLLIEYLSGLDTASVRFDYSIQSIMYENIIPQDISVAGQDEWRKYLKRWLNLDSEHQRQIQILQKYKESTFNFEDLREKFKSMNYGFSKILSTMQLLSKQVGIKPENIMILNFNYTANANRYLQQEDCFRLNQIHGDLLNAKNIIFGYGDELDRDYNDILSLNDNEYLRNMKSIKYLESSNYRDMLSFIESAPYQVYIMGHSCGNSDRTLLNTLFEHRNCVTIKPFYYEKEDGTDNYLDLVQNISRNFTDMKLMRDRVVNKTFCEPMPQL